MVKKRPCPSRGMYRRNQCIATEVAGAIFRSLGTDSGIHAAGLLERGDFISLLSSNINPLDYDDSGAFRDDYLVVEMMSKFPNFDVGIDRQAVALEKFRISEKVCLETNDRLRRSYGKASTTLSLASYMHTARGKIARLLGPLNWDEAEQHFDFGPGSTTSLRRNRGDAYYKFGALRPDVTKECLALAFTAVRRAPRWFLHLSGFSGEYSEMAVTELAQGVNPADIFRVVPGNQVITVPKNAKTDRVIAKEPDLNMYLQKGLGGVIRRRLKKVHVDLDDQSRNQELACEGSLSGTLATLDLSAASDSISMELVKQLLPSDWVEAIETCRSPVGVLPDGTTIVYQKVSSMGNGYTFELESLIFWALVSSVLDYSETSERRVAVYGDDLIFSVEIYDSVVDLLQFCGFQANEKKSFHTGKFRESCGKHWFSGRDVTPFYIREGVEDPARLLWLANSIRRFARLGRPWTLDARFETTYRDVVARLPRFWQIPRIPDGFGDVALFGDFDEVRPYKARNGLEGWQCTGVSEKLTSKLPDDLPILIKATKILDKKPVSFGQQLEIQSNGVIRETVGNRFPKELSRIHSYLRQVEGVAVSLLPVSIRKKVASWRIVRFTSQQWENFGPWV